MIRKCSIPGCQRRTHCENCTLCNDHFDGLMSRIFGQKTVRGRPGVFEPPVTEALRQNVHRGIIKTSREDKPDVR